LLLRPASEEDWTRLRADIGRLVARRVPAGADVEDVTQDVLLRVWRHGDSLREEERFGAWLSRIAHTAAAEHLRARQRHPLSRFAESEGIDPGVTEDSPAKDLIAAVLRPFIARLPETYREAVVLSELDGLPHAAVAARLALSVSGVKSRVQRGRAQLRAMLEACCEIALDARGKPVSCEVRVRTGRPHSGCASCCTQRG
jgi:RNA polymerase sigma-70 factor, ECF subfamily